MKVALVHDYIKEYGGAERVLRVLSDMYPDAPIYTAFRVRSSTADKHFKDRRIVESWLAPILKLWRLYSPLRFLIPFIWGSMDLSEYELVITSASWYVTRGFKVGPKTKVVCYCHTPPRWLYGYETSVGFTRYWPVKIYAAIVGHILRIYDFKVSQPTSELRGPKKSVFRGGVDFFVANSKNVQDRIRKFYRRESVVIYPPVDVQTIKRQAQLVEKKENFYLIVSRLVGAKGLENAAKASKKLGFKLKIVGEAHGFADVEKNLKKISGGNLELLGRVEDEKLWQLYAKARGFVALARDEDFGMTVVEAQAAGTPVIAFNGGGFKESVVDPSTGSGRGATGILIRDTDTNTIEKAIKKLERTKWNKKVLQDNAQKFSKERFEKEIKELVESRMK